MDAVCKGDTDSNKLGKRIILPSSHTGSPRYRIQNYQDAMAICRWAGYPDLFITFTCNPKWTEINYMLEMIGQKDDKSRVDIICRVFKIKLQELLNDLKHKMHFGCTNAILYTIEFQKRGLPHAHILLFLHPEQKDHYPTRIDKIISAEIPDEKEDLIAYTAVKNHMIHGPCGILNKNAPCMIRGKCSKHFPRSYCDHTSIDENGFPIYRRRQTSTSIQKKKVFLDNRFVVPYNRDLLLKFDAHICVELCNYARSIKYLFKYINKGPDRATVTLEKAEQSKEIDEIKMYLDCRYISATEACWRIFQFDIHSREPAVERLPYHLPGEQMVIFEENTSLVNVVNREGVEKTKFTEWMLANKLYEDARQLTYAEFPMHWVWNAKEKRWCKRNSLVFLSRESFAFPSHL